jgi:hypothetical protein
LAFQGGWLSLSKQGPNLQYPDWQVAEGLQHCLEAEAREEEEEEEEGSQP